MNLDEFGIVESLIVLITGLIVVFAMLVLLIVIIKIYGSAIYKMHNGGKGKKKEPENKEVKPAVPPVQKAQTLPAAQPAVEAGIPGEVVAAIAAAVACLDGEGTGYKLKGVRRAAAVRPVWGAAGLAENTRPF